MFKFPGPIGALPGTQVGGWVGGVVPKADVANSRDDVVKERTLESGNLAFSPSSAANC